VKNFLVDTGFAILAPEPATPLPALILFLKALLIGVPGFLLNPAEIQKIIC
jgi:hypothetical protein